MTINLLLDTKLFYRTFKFIDTHLNWHEAREHCFSLGGRLAETRNPTQYGVVERLTPDGSNVWLGACDGLPEGHWVWVSDHVVVPTLAGHWAPRQPNNGGDSLYSEDCMEYRSYKGWNDRDCTSVKHGFFCEFGGSGDIRLCH